MHKVSGEHLKTSRPYLQPEMSYEHGFDPQRLRRYGYFKGTSTKTSTADPSVRKLLIQVLRDVPREMWRYTVMLLVHV